MTDYYVQVRKGGAWHELSERWMWLTKCGVRSGRYLLWGMPEWYAESIKPQQPLCKRCERSKK